MSTRTEVLCYTVGARDTWEWDRVQNGKGRGRRQSIKEDFLEEEALALSENGAALAFDT